MSLLHLKLPFPPGPRGPDQLCTQTPTPALRSDTRPTAPGPYAAPPGLCTQGAPIPARSLHVVLEAPCSNQVAHLKSFEGKPPGHKLHELLFHVFAPTKNKA